VVTSPERERVPLHSASYDVADLTRRDPAAADALAKLVQQMVVPHAWKAADGPGTIAAKPDVLAVAQTNAVHYEVLGFLERLRVARRLPLRSQFEPQRFSLATRWSRASAALVRPVTVAFHQPTPRAEVLSAVEQPGPTRIYVDWAALGAAGVPSHVKAAWKANRQPLAAALDDLLQPLGLGWRPVDADLIQVTSRAALTARLELEFYPVSDLISPERSGPAIAEQVRAGLAKETWNDAGGPAAVHFDEPSRHLIVLQSPPVHAAVEKFLAQLRPKQKRPA